MGYAPFLSKPVSHPLELTHRGGWIYGCCDQTAPDLPVSAGRYTPLCWKLKSR
ncbi:Uncharacterised protein [Vibrio cholerae]|nr:Uncharacterised protein [Vibrio cholerae]